MKTPVSACMRALRLAPLVILVSVMAPGAIWPSRVGIHPEEPLIRQADVIAVVAVREAKYFQKRSGDRVCWEDVTMELVPRLAIRGALPAGTVLLFAYRLLVDDHGPCPRLQYVNPPHAVMTRSGEVAGMEIIATIREIRTPEKTSYQVTGTYPLDALRRIEALMK